MTDYPVAILLKTAEAGVRLQTAGKLAEATSLYREVLDQEGMPADVRDGVMWNLGSCLIQLERWSEAASVFARLRECAPQWRERSEKNFKICAYHAVNQTMEAVPIAQDAILVPRVSVRRVPGRIFRRPGSSDGYYDPDFCAFLETGAAATDDGRLVLFDVGANNGVLSTYAAMTKHLRTEIHAFEPNPHAFAELVQNVEDEGLAGAVHCHPVAVADRVEDAAELLTPAKHAPELSRLSGPHPLLGGAEWVSHRVRVVRLDDLGLPDPGLIKIDVEDHEYNVLAGAEALLGRAKPIVYFENWYYGFNFAGTVAPLAFLEERGYRLFVPLWRTGSAAEPIYTAEHPEGDLSGASLLLNPLTAVQRLGYKDNTNVLAIHADRLDTVKTRLVRAGRTGRPDA